MRIYINASSSCIAVHVDLEEQQYHKMLTSDTVDIFRGWHVTDFNESHLLCIMRMAYYLMELKWHQFKASPSYLGIVLVLVVARGVDTYSIIWVRITDTTVSTEEDIERLLRTPNFQNMIQFPLHRTYLKQCFAKR